MATAKQSPEQTPHARLKTAIREIVETHRQEHVFVLVDVLIKSHEAIVLTWARSVIGQMVRAAKRAPEADPRQEWLPGFERMNERLPLKPKGKKSRSVPLLLATPALIREAMVVVRKQQLQLMATTLSVVRGNADKKLKAKMERLQTLLNGMEPYGDPRLTVEGYLELKTQGKFPPARPRDRKRKRLDD